MILVHNNISVDQDQPYAKKKFLRNSPTYKTIINKTSLNKQLNFYSSPWNYLKSPNYHVNVPLYAWLLLQLSLHHHLIKITHHQSLHPIHWRLPLTTTMFSGNVIFFRQEFLKKKLISWTQRLAWTLYPWTQCPGQTLCFHGHNVYTLEVVSI